MVAVLIVLTRDVLGVDWSSSLPLVSSSSSWLSFRALLRVVITLIHGRLSSLRLLSLHRRSMLGFSIPSTGFFLPLGWKSKLAQLERRPTFYLLLGFL